MKYNTQYTLVPGGLLGLANEVMIVVIGCYCGLGQKSCAALWTALFAYISTLCITNTLHYKNDKELRLLHVEVKFIGGIMFV
jgi:uncharacterized membrane protein